MAVDLHRNPYCGNLIGIDTEKTYFVNCCNFGWVLSQTCATINGIQSCETNLIFILPFSGQNISLISA